MFFDYAVKKGLCGNLFAVFSGEDEAKDALVYWPNSWLTCFGGYLNAIQLTGL